MYKCVYAAQLLLLPADKFDVYGLCGNGSYSRHHATHPKIYICMTTVVFHYIEINGRYVADVRPCLCTCLCLHRICLYNGINLFYLVCFMVSALLKHRIR